MGTSARKRPLPPTCIRPHQLHCAYELLPCSPIIQLNSATPQAQRRPVRHEELVRHRACQLSMQRGNILVLRWFSILGLGEEAARPNTNRNSARCPDIGPEFFLEQIDAAAHLSQTTILAIKRDHVKGFDYLDESAYYDCLRFLASTRR